MLAQSYRTTNLLFVSTFDSLGDLLANFSTATHRRTVGCFGQGGAGGGERYVLDNKHTAGTIAIGHLLHTF